MLELADGDFSASVVLRDLVVSGDVKAAQQAIDKAMVPTKQRAPGMKETDETHR